MMNKRGQFYLISAIIISVIILGLAGITNYSRFNEEPIRINQLGDVVGQETSFVVEWTYYNETEDIEEKLNENLNTALEGFKDVAESSSEVFQILILYPTDVMKAAQNSKEIHFKIMNFNSAAEIYPVVIGGLDTGTDEEDIYVIPEITNLEFNEIDISDEFKVFINQEGTKIMIHPSDYFTSSKIILEYNGLKSSAFIISSSSELEEYISTNLKLETNE